MRHKKTIMLENHDSQSCFFFSFFENPWFGVWSQKKHLSLLISSPSIFPYFSQQKTRLTNIETIVWPHIQGQDGRVGAMPRTMDKIPYESNSTTNRQNTQNHKRTQPTTKVCVCFFLSFCSSPSLYIVYSIQQYMLYNYIYIVI